MPERIKAQKPVPQKQASKTDAAPQSKVQGDKLKAELDDLLDEIDSVLEENAEEFLEAYVQRGGE